MCPALAGRFSTTAPPGKPNLYFYLLYLTTSFHCHKLGLPQSKLVSLISPLFQVTVSSLGKGGSYSNHKSDHITPLFKLFTAARVLMVFFCVLCNLPLTLPLSHLHSIPYLYGAPHYCSPLLDTHQLQIPCPFCSFLVYSFLRYQHNRLPHLLQVFSQIIYSKM